MTTINHPLSRRVALRSLATALALAVSLAWISGAIAQVDSANVAAKIAAANTAADHEAIAAYYRSQAAAAAAKVKEHEAMMASYKSGGKGGIALADHCKTLIARYSADEKDYTMMAAEHDAMAKASK